MRNVRDYYPPKDYHRAFLCGVCMFSPCSQGVSSNKNPKRKNMQKQNMCPFSVTETDGSLGPRALRSCPLLLEGPGGRMVRDGSNAERTFHSDLRPACVCVCVSCVATYICTCALQCVVC